MKLLLDTHVVIWLALGDPRIPARVHEALTTADASFVSVASGWKYEVKRRRQRPGSGFDLSFVELIEAMPVEPLGLDFAVHRHAATLEAIHADPFDRMLVAQALHHGLVLVTVDEAIRRYPVPTLWD